MPEALRIALVSQEYPPETAAGGIGTQTYMKAHGLAARGHRVSVIARSPDGTRREYRDGDVEVIRIPGFIEGVPAYTDAADWLTYSTSVARELATLQQRARIDLIDFPEWGGEGYVYLLGRADWDLARVVIQLHGPVVLFAHTGAWPEPGSELYHLGTTMEGTCLRLADAVFSSSACSARWAASHYGLSSESIPTLHTGVDRALFSPRPVARATRPTIISAGRLTPDKGTDVLVEAACRLLPEFPDLRLRLLGHGRPDFVARLEATARAHGGTDLLELPGFVARTELADELSRAHVFALPSLYEPGPGLVYLEAMACGLPAVASSGAGAAEVVHHEHNGLLVPPGDPEALSAALGRLLRDGALREAMAARAVEYVAATADSADCLRRIEAFYLDVVHQSVARAAAATAGAEAAQ